MRTRFLKSILLVCLLTCFGFEAIAQADADSPYSLFGVGQVRDKSMNTRLRGMGGVANAMFDGGMINAENPASYAKIDSLAFLFDAGFYFKTSTFSTSSLSEKANNASFDYVSMAFGLTPWWKMALGVQPYSTTGYTMKVDKDILDVGTTTTRFQGKGGLNQAFVGTAFKLGRHFALGANAYYVFGNTQTETSLYFPDSAYYIGSRRSVDVMVSSFMFDYGMLFNTKVGNDMNLSVGLTYCQKVKLKGSQTMFIRSIEEDMDTEIEYVIDTVAYFSGQTKITMPQGFGVGVALQKNDRWAVRFTANDVDSLHGISAAWLGSALKVSTAEHKIIVTHHCPTMRLPFNAFHDSTLNSAFQVDMDNFIEGCEADYWIYGHTHFAGGSGTVIGKTQLLCNQMGYVYYNEHHDFNPSAYLDVLP